MKNLLESYLENSILYDDFQTLSAGLDEMSDEELARLLMEDWEKCGFEELPSTKKKALFPVAVPKPAHSRMKKFLWGVSACLSVVCCALCVELFSKNALFDEMSAKMVVVKSEMEGHTNLSLPDGTVVKLNSGSVLKYSMDFGTKDRNIFLEGEGFFDVAKNPEKQFVVSAGGIQVAVYGTKFNINAYSFRDDVEVSLIEGSVKILTPDKSLMITPGELACFNKSDGDLKVEKLDTRLSTVWMDKDVIFSHDSLQRVFDVLEHRFNVHIKYSGSMNLEDKYTGSFGDRRIEDILSILKLHYGFDYTIKNNEVTIKK